MGDNDDFGRLVWPHVKAALDVIDYNCVEGRDSLLDTRACTDYVVLEKTGLVFGLASRIQRMGPFASFTMRADLSSGNKTEMDKLNTVTYTAAWPIRYFCPSYHVQAYVVDGSLDALYIIGTVLACVYLSADREGRYWTPLRNGHDGNVAQTLWVDALVRGGIRVWAFERPGACVSTKNATGINYQRRAFFTEGRWVSSDGQGDLLST